MIEVVPFDNLGRFENSWLNARYHFSFANYYDPSRMGFGPLRVVNDDTVRAHAGFGRHGHRDMEIITYIRKGAISHADNLGNNGRIAAGDVQVMSAGTGIFHSEHNREDEDTQLYQIWIEPAERGLAPAYWQRSFPKEARRNRLKVLASGRQGDAGEEVLPIRQDAALLAAVLDAGAGVEHRLAAGRRAYLLVPAGKVTVSGTEIGTRDGAKAVDMASLAVTAEEPSELLILDLP